MRIVVTGSIATDHLMAFPGRFVDSIVPEKLDSISLSFLVDRLDVHRGGVGANIAFGLGRLGVPSALVGAVGEDFADYRSWLNRHGVDTDSVHISSEHHTARFVCTTDMDHNQIATFYAGAMAEARNIELLPVVERLGGVDLVVIGPNDPAAMVRHTEECRERGYAFASDPSQQLARMDGDEIRRLIDGATYLFTNEYEAALTEHKTGWSSDDILQRVGCRVTTMGSKGARVERRGQATVTVHCAPERVKLDPTGVGDAFRAGFVAGLTWGLSDRLCAEVGSMLATYVIETQGTQEYDFTAEAFLARFADAYGVESAAAVSAGRRGTG